MRGWFLLGCVSVGLLPVAMLDCSSDHSTSAAPFDCAPADGGVASYIAAIGAEGGATSACGQCLEQTCPDLITECAGDCACSATVTTALQCLFPAGDGAAGSASCLGPLEGSAESTAVNMGTCMLACGAFCGGIGSVVACPDGGLEDHFGSGDNACAECVATSCDVATLACEDDCTCNAVASSALDCLSATLDASTASITACVAPLIAVGPDSGSANLGQCIVTSCVAACEGVLDAGTGTGDDDGATEDGGSDAAVLDSGIDATTADSGPDSGITDAGGDADAAD